MQVREALELIKEVHVLKSSHQSVEQSKAVFIGKLSQKFKSKKNDKYKNKEGSFFIGTGIAKELKKHVNDKPDIDPNYVERKAGELLL
ncbi:hypothetical protein JYT72_00555 [Crocinitomix catalasitica]|nr:hypothetical protein [Crocinitomix catalasitica]